MTLVACGRVLFVDNAVDWRTVLAHLLQHEEPSRYAIVADLRHAREQVATGEFDVVVCDWHMPGDAIEFLRFVRSSYPDLLCILLTGFKHSLPDGLKSELERIRVPIYDKDQATSDWIAALLDPEKRRRALEDEQHSESVAGITDAPESVRDKLYSQRLMLETLRREIRSQRSIIESVAEDLIEDLQSLPDRDVANLFGPGPPMTMNDMIKAIEDQSELGKRLLRLDRTIQKRLRGGK